MKNQIDAVKIAIDLTNENLNELKARKAVLIKSFEEQPLLIKEYNSLQQKLEIANRNLFGLVSARENFQLQIAQSSIPWRIIEEPRMFSRPISPSLKKEFTFSLFFGLIGGILVGFIRDRFDHVFHSEREVSSDLKLPLIGNMPYVDIFKEGVEKKENFLNILDANFKNKEDKKDPYQIFYYKEAIRSICTSIRFLDTEKNNRVLHVTSSVPSEGKSLINILIAKTFSEQGKKVLLVDLDLRKPQLHKRLRKNNLIGISNFLTENDLQLEDIKQKVFESAETIDFVSAGILPPDPTSILNSERMSIFISECKKIYDFIILDSPPIIGLSDSLIISSMADTKLLIVSINKVDRALPFECIKKLKLASNNFNGIITNNLLEIDNFENLIYGYSGKYGYGTYQTYAKYSNQENEKTNPNINDNGSKTYNFIKYLKEIIKKVFNWLDK